MLVAAPRRNELLSSGGPTETETEKVRDGEDADRQHTRRMHFPEKPAIRARAARALRKAGYWWPVSLV